MNKAFKTINYQMEELIDCAKILHDSIVHTIEGDLYFFKVITGVLRSLLVDNDKNQKPLFVRISNLFPIDCFFYYKIDKLKINEDNWLLYTISKIKHDDEFKKTNINDFLELPLVHTQKIQSNKLITKSIKEVIRDFTNKFGVAHIPDEAFEYIAIMYILELKNIEKNKDVISKMQRKSGIKEPSNTFIMPLTRLFSSLGKLIIDFTHEICHKYYEWDFFISICIEELDPKKSEIHIFETELPGEKQFDMSLLDRGVMFEIFGHTEEPIKIYSKRVLGMKRKKLINLSHRINSRFESEFTLLIDNIIFKKIVCPMVYQMVSPLPASFGNIGLNNKIRTSLCGFTVAFHKREKTLFKQFEKHKSEEDNWVLLSSEKRNPKTVKSAGGFFF